MTSFAIYHSIKHFCGRTFERKNAYCFLRFGGYIKQLKKRRRDELEKLLSIFDQDNLTKNHHILNVNEDEFPEEYRTIIRRLRMASENDEVQIQMEMEDDFMKELQDKERLLSEAK